MRAHMVKVTAALLALAVVIVGVAWVTVDDDSEDGERRCEIDVAVLQSTVTAAAGWLDRARQPDGRFWYEYDRSSDEFSRTYNLVRHAGTMMSLYQIAADGDDSVLPTADAGLDFVLAGLATSGDRTAFVGSDRAAMLGATALTVAGLVHRRIATGDSSHDDLMRSMSRFMQSLMRDDGGMWAEATARDLVPREGVTSTFFTGEAFWAFGLMANQFPDEGWGRAADATGTYIATQRDAEEEIEDPPLADQWAAYGFAEMREWDPLGEAELTYVRSLVDRYHDRLGRELAREARRVGDGTGEPDETVEQVRGAAFGTTVEALGSLWRLSVVDPGLDDLTGQLRDDLICGATILAARQYSEERAADWPRPEVVEGAWYVDDVTRVDDQQHAMSAVQLSIAALDNR